MSLNKTKLIQDIINIQEDMLGKEEKSIEHYANQLATAIDAFVKSGTVTVDAGISVTTTGSASTQSGKTTAKGKGKIT